MAIASKPKKALSVAVSTPTAGFIHAAYAMSLTPMVLHFLQTPILPEIYDVKNIATQLQVGANIGQARDNMCDQAIEQGYTHLLFIDDDMGFRPECLIMALQRQLPIVLANYRRKIPPGIFTAARQDKDGNVYELITSEDKTSCEECLYAGFGFCLIETEVLKAVKRPRFLMEYQPEWDGYTTEDWPFFREAKKAGYPAFVDHEISKRVWHNGSFAYSFDQQLDPKWAKPYAERMQIVDKPTND